jgi:hypothetical protein
MRVSELTPGMLLRPKKGCTFSLYKTWEAIKSMKPPLAYTQLECHARRTPHKKLGTAPVIYIGMIDKSVSGARGVYQYEARRTVFCTATGSKIKVAPEAWRNMEAVTDEE